MKQTVRNIAMITGGSLTMTIIIYAVNFWIFSPNSRINPKDALFIEGIASIMVGILFFIGSGGIDRWSRSAAILAAAAEAISGREQPKPSEIYRRDAWKPRGFERLSLTLIIAGILLLVLYFISL